MAEEPIDHEEEELIEEAPRRRPRRTLKHYIVFTGLWIMGFLAFIFGLAFMVVVYNEDKNLPATEALIAIFTVVGEIIKAIASSE